MPENLEEQQTIENTNRLARDLHWLEKLNIVSQVVLVIIGTIAAVIYSRQLHAMNEQLREMKDSGRQTDTLLCLYARQLAALQQQDVDAQVAIARSAYDTIIDTKTHTAYVKVSFEKPLGTPEGYTAIPMKIANIGNTPATSVDVRIEAHILGKDAPLRFGYIKQDDTLRTSILRAGDSFFRDDDPHYALIRSGDGTPKVFLPNSADLAEVRAGNAAIILYGKVTYRDIFAIKHWSHFCMQITGRATDGVTMNGRHDCNIYNQDDENAVIKPGSVSLKKAKEIPYIPCPAGQPS